MITASRNARRLLPGAALVVCCLAVPANADELQYLPDNVRVVASFNITTGAKTKTFQEFMKSMMMLQPNKDQQEQIDNFTSKIGRITVGVGMTENEAENTVEIATAVKTITADEVKALKKANPVQENYTWKEIKHGAVTIHQPSWTSKFDKEAKPRLGDAFYLVDGKYIVSSSKVSALTTIIDRKKPAMLSPVVQDGLKDAGFNNVVSVVVDVQNMPAARKENMIEMFKGLPTYADMKANVGKVRSLTVKVNEPGKVKMSATLTCVDKASVDVVKTIGEKSLAAMKAKVNEAPTEKLPPGFLKFIDGARTALKAIQVTAMGTKVTASAEIEPETAMYAAVGFLFVSSVSTEKGKVEVDKAPSK